MFRRPRRRLPFPLGLYQTAVGKKWVMGVTGVMLMGYVLVHMIGNLHMYEGPEHFNAYGESLRDLGRRARAPHLGAVVAAPRADRRLRARTSTPPSP